jgi:RNA 2',3'-cyclic 3'-phosphodiesterase
MTRQLSLDGFSADPTPTDRLFIGIFPPAPVSARILRTAEELRARHGLTGKPLSPERFHITLFHLGDYVGLPEGLARSAGEAAAGVSAAAFEVRFDFSESFAAKLRSQPLVLRASNGAGPLIDFQARLGNALRKAGLGRHAGPQFTPHVTLLYDAQCVAREPVEPLGWTVNEFVLVHSLLAQTRHLKIGHWPLHA